MEYRAGLWLLLIPTLLGSAEAKRAYTIELKNFSCLANGPLPSGEVSCITHRKLIEPAISVRFKLKETVKKFDIDFNVDILKKDNSKVTLAHAQLDGCKYLSSFYSSSRYGLFFKRIQNLSNLPKKCPVPGEQLFEIRNYTILVDEFPPVVPAITYQLLLKILRPDKTAIAEIMVEASIIY